MTTVRTILSIGVIFILASCSTSTPAATPSSTPTIKPQPTITATDTPAPVDIPMYKNAFDAISDLATSGITSSNANVSLTTENFNYPSPGSALKLQGTMAEEPYTTLNLDISIKKLTGQTSLDLSNKTVGISYFIPLDSTIDDVIIVLTKSDIGVSIGDNLLGTGWVDQTWNLSKVYTDASWGWTNGSVDQARDVISHCESISIQAVRHASGTPAPALASIYMDDLNWIGIDISHIPVDNTVDSLRKAAANQHFKIGLWAANMNIFGNGYDLQPDPWLAYTVAQEGTINTVWMLTALPGEDYNVFDYDRPEDAAVLQQYKFGNDNSLTTLGYGIGGMYIASPQWIRDLAFPEATKALLLYHIEKDVRYTKDQHPIWLLFNEPVQGTNEAIPHAMYNYPVGLNNRQNTDPVASSCCYSPWAADMYDSSLIQAAFIKAREVDPGATLLINGQDNEVMGRRRSEFFLTFASDLKAQGIPIDGVGFQMHNYITPDGELKFWILSNVPFEYIFMDLDEYLNNVDQNVKRYASQGLKVAFTEVDGFIKFDDIDFTTADGRAEYESRLQWQAKYYAGLLKIAMENENVILYHMWEITEKYPGAASMLVPGYGHSGIFDKNYNPKPAYDAMLELLKNP